MNTPRAINELCAGALRGLRVNLVGGGVLDLLGGRDPRDWDLEVYDASYDELVARITNAGLRADLVGKEFGIIKVDIDGLDIDLSIPRRDNRQGVGHRGFACEFGNMTPAEAARRRDFTFNSLALDVRTGELHDFFGGLADYRAGILRVTDPGSFVEDPLRVLRGMQLLARKATVADPGTVELCRSMIDEYGTLAPERVFAEFRKLLLKAARPSVGLEFLRATGWLAHFPALAALVGCPQHPIHHPEGDVWTHTLRVVDAAAALRGQISDPTEREAFMWAALLHDVGKPATTPDVPPLEITSYGHDEAGAPLAGALMESLRAPKRLTALVAALVRCHMRTGAITRAESGVRAWRRLYHDVDGHLVLLGLLSRADTAGSGHTDTTSGAHRPLVLARQYQEVLRQAEATPLVRGRDLIAAGLEPGRHFRARLKAAMDAQLAGCGYADCLRSALEA